MGGAIASLYAATYPEEVKTLMLISPAGVHNIPSDMDKIIKEKGTNPLIASSVSQFFEVIDFVMEDKPFIPDAILTVQAEKSVRRYALNQKIFSDIRKDLEKNLDQKFSQINAQTLILWGKEDRVINVENSQRYAELIPNAKPSILEGIGHLAMIEAPELAAQAFINLSSASEYPAN
jgi:pimeloyl-ACP methyl ester carboxylesterase